MTQEQYKEFVEKFGKEAAEQMQKLAKEVETTLTAKYNDVIAGAMKREDFDLFKKEQEALLNEKLGAITKLEDALKEQGTALKAIQTNTEKHEPKTLVDFVREQMPKLKEIQAKGSGFIEITSKDLKAAGVTNIIGGTTIQTMTPSLTNPYLPGIGGGPLELFEIIRNPNFILNKVDVGSTDSYRLAWINETGMEGNVSEVLEGGLKPLIQHTFKVEFSEPKKAAAYFELTEEFEQDVPGLATQIRRLLQQDVIRYFDDQIQAAIIAASRPYNITTLDGRIGDANPWDALGAAYAQISYYNFIPNTIALNPVTMWQIWMSKDNEGRHLNPPFLPKLNDKFVEATKVQVDNMLVGDLKQFKVDIYKDFVIKMGWYNDQFIRNMFSIVGEIRYHRYISDNRKNALLYDNVFNVRTRIDGGSGSW